MDKKGSGGQVDELIVKEQKKNPNISDKNIKILHVT